MFILDCDLKIWEWLKHTSFSKIPLAVGVMVLHIETNYHTFPLSTRVYISVSSKFSYNFRPYVWRTIGNGKALSALTFIKKQDLWYFITFGIILLALALDADLWMNGCYGGLFRPSNFCQREYTRYWRSKTSVCVPRVRVIIRNKFNILLCPWDILITWKSIQ